MSPKRKSRPAMQLVPQRRNGNGAGNRRDDGARQ